MCVIRPRLWRLLSFDSTLERAIGEQRQIQPSCSRKLGVKRELRMCDKNPQRARPRLPDNELRSQLEQEVTAVQDLLFYGSMRVDTTGRITLRLNHFPLKTGNVCTTETPRQTVGEATKVNVCLRDLKSKSKFACLSGLTTEGVLRYVILLC